MRKLIGRELEIKQLDRYEKSGRPEFVAIYGRRRVGKTFLVRQFFGDRICFSASGTFKDSRTVQLKNFAQELSFRTGSRPIKLKDWTDAFWQLEQYLRSLPAEGMRKIIFLDELPWFDTQKSGFLRALDYFWNHFLSERDDCMLVVCGSATSWMVDNLVDDRGGLHNRITHEIHLHPFSLKEVEQYLKNAGFKWPRIMVLQTYMILGGIPYYLDMLERDETFPANVDHLMFSENAPLRDEFRRLYDSLFGRSAKYRAVITELSRNGRGLTRNEISKAVRLNSGGNLTEILNDLVNCDFVRYYPVRRKTLVRNSGIYQLTDFFTIFYFEFLDGKSPASDYWSRMMKSQKLSNWQGLAYERVCSSHMMQIKKALRIDAVYSEHFSWRGGSSGHKAQIDIVIERADNMTNVCEVKYCSSGEYVLTGDESERIRNRAAAYAEETGSRNGILLTLITTYGLKSNAHSDELDSVVILDDLFQV